MKKFEKGIGGVAPVGAKTPNPAAAAPPRKAVKNNPISRLGAYAHPPKGKKK